MKIKPWHARLCGYVTLLFCYLLPGLSVSVQAQALTPEARRTNSQASQAEDSEYILIINTLNESDPWNRNIIDTVTTELSRLAPNLVVLTDNLNMSMMLTPEDQTRMRHRIDSTYAKKPRMVIYTGSAGWRVVHETIERKWGIIPTILFTSEDFVGPNRHYIEKTVVPPKERIPLAQIAAQHGKMTVVYLPVYIRETIDLMKRVIPDMNELLFLSDGRWSSAQTRAELGAIAKAYFPELKIHYLNVNDISTPDLFDTLQNRGKHSGVIFFSWTRQATQESNASNAIVNDAAYKIIGKYSKQPLFVLSDIDVNTDNDVIGGYFPTRQTVSQEIHLVLTDALAGRMQPLRVVSDARPVFDYLSMVRKGLDPNLLPGNAYFYWKPESFLSKYRYQFTGFGLLGVILLLIIYILLRSKQQQRRQLSLMADYRDLFDNMPIGYMKMEMQLDQNGQPEDLIVRDVNPTFDKSFIPYEKIVGQRACVPGNPESRNALSLCKTVLAEQRMTSVPYYLKQTNTNYTVIIAPTQKANFIDIFYIDNTALIEAQQLLRTVNHKLAMALEVADITPWKWDLKSQMILCDMNRSVELMGLPNTDDNKLSVPETEYFAKIHKHDLERVKQAYRDLVEGRVAKIREEYRVVTHEGGHSHFNWVEVQAAVDNRDENGQPLTLIGSSLVITMRKNMENELVTAKEKAEESSRLKSAFLANMSHEIRTPLNAIVGFSGILATTDTEEDKREYVSIIENNNTLLLQLISDILDLSKIEAGTLEFVYTDTDLKRMLDEIVQAAQMRNTSDKVKVELAEAPDCYIQTERNRITQVLTNLLTNALKFTQEGSIQVGCKLQEGQKFFYFYVKDTGCGIPEEKQKKVFDRFVKLNNFSQGTGLGLSICQTIIEHMGGQIGLESKEGEGSTFWFRIPYRPAKRQELATPKIEPEQTAVERDKLTILIAEDSADNFKLFETILSKEYKILHAWDGREAVELFDLHKPHMILMDINMPLMDGYEATAEIRKRSDRVPIIAVTAYAYTSDEERIMQSGFDAYLPKPINAALIRKKIIELMKKRLIFI